MALQPVSGVTPLRTTNLTFSGRRSNDEVNDSFYSRIPAQVKAVPVIVLMAMSPLNKINATDSINDLPEVNNVEYLKIVNNNKPTVLKSYDIVENGYKYYTVKKLSFDDNPNTFEGIEVLKLDGEDVMSRMMVTYILPGKTSEGKSFLYVYGFKLPVDDLDDYTPAKSFYAENKSPTNNGAAREPLSKLLTGFCRDTVANNCAISMGKALTTPQKTKTTTNVRRNLNKLIGNEE